VGINREMSSLLAHNGAESKQHLKNLLNNPGYRDSKHFESPLGIPGGFNAHVQLSREDIIYEIITRIMFGDDVPV
jgi:hypothetical protein